MNRSQTTTTELEKPRLEGGPATNGARAHDRLLEGLPVSQQRIMVGGVSTSVLRGGQGPPIVLLHGPGGYAAQWFRVIPALVETHSVIAPDLPGHGTSEIPDSPIDAGDILNWLDELIEKTCAAPPVIVGHLAGGAIGARYAIRSDRCLERLVLVDSLGLAPFEPAPEFGAALNAFFSDPSAATHDQFWDRCAFDLDTLRHRMGGRWAALKEYNLDRAMSPDRRKAAQSLIQEFGVQAIPESELARINVPVSLIWGRNDLATDLSVAEDASSRFGWPLYVVEDAADDPAMEQPDAFVEMLRLDEVRSAWDEIAVGYDRTNTPSQMSLARESLRRAGLEKGMRFLDVAAGSGALSIPAAQMGARVMATDLSPAMLDLLGARATGEGLDIETRVMDGHNLDFDDGRFDVAGSQFGVMLFPDLPKAVREMVRVVKPGGRVLISGYGDPNQIEFLGLFVHAVQSVRPDFSGPPSDPPPLEFQLADPDVFAEELSRAGLEHVEVETLKETTRFRNGEELFDWVINSNPIVGTMLRDLELSDEERRAIRSILDKMVRKRAGQDETAALTNPVNVGIGVKAS